MHFDDKFGQSNNDTTKTQKEKTPNATPLGDTKPSTQSATGSSNIDFMRKAVKNLNDRVQDVEKKITKVENLLKNQKNDIKKQVVADKEQWMDSFV